MTRRLYTRANPVAEITLKTSSTPKDPAALSDGESMVARFAAVITAALLLAACGNAITNKAKETMTSYKAAQESSLRAIR